MRRRKVDLHELLVIIALFIFSSVVVTSCYISKTYAKYQSIVTGSDNAAVAKFGNLNFTEYTSSGSAVTGNIAQTELITVTAGNNVNKRISLSYLDCEVASYVFIEVEADGWIMDEGNNISKLSIKNASGDSMVSWTINNNWNYLGNYNNKFVIYHTVLANENFTDNLMTEIEVNAISLDDVSLLINNNYSLNFKAYVISKTGATPEDAWEAIISN